MRKLLACLALLVLATGFSSGCWSRRELSELAIVLGAGVDRAPDNQVRLTLQLARPGSFTGGGTIPGGKNEPTAWVISETGETLLDAQRKMAGRISRQIYWAHNIVLIFGEEAARYGIRHYNNFFTRGPQSRETVWVMVAEGEARDILETHAGLESSSAQDIGSLARSKKVYSVIYKDFIVMLATMGSNPVVPRVEIVESGVVLGGEAQERPVDHKGAALTGTAVFREERLAGWLDESETRGMTWLRGEMMKGIVTVPSLNYPDKNTSVEITRGHAEVEPQYDGESVWFDVKLTIEGDLLELQDKEEILEREVRKSIEKTIAGEVQKEARVTLDKAQRELGLDIFNFGVAFHRKYPGIWPEIKDNWDEIFAGAGVNIDVEMDIRRSGMTARRASMRQ